ncbi:MAG: nicotinate-nucleotide--dimethylbenzimidazole phosphoribosyltransferase [Lachnospiraceae bacterium]|nr:nicotinate-nucleotide--dimethylbenzimidazole phosphoribosyltransferase [Lachnospiraceae bacterium]
MTKNELKELKIDKPDSKVYNAVKQSWDALSKPLDGLGDFEALICRIGAIQERIIPCADNKTLVVFCADNGIVNEGVSQCGKEVTSLVAASLGKGVSTANVMAKSAGVRVVPVDIGIDCEDKIPGVIDRKVVRGTKSFLSEPAMSEEELLNAISCGIDIAKELIYEGVDILAAGEMGIGNTTSSSAVLCSLLEKDASLLTGRGAGLDDTGLEKKFNVIKTGLKKYVYLQELSGFDRGYETLRCLGGLEIAGMTGLYIGAAINHIPIVADGLISLTAALLAEYLVPGAKDYVIASHNGRERGVALVLSELKLKAFINGNMALGEGTGALMLFPLIDMALALYRDGIHFEEAGIAAYERYNR